MPKKPAKKKPSEKRSKKSELLRKKSDLYLKVVEWSQEDGCYVGSAPGLILGGVHGNDERKVCEELCEAMEGGNDLLEREGRPLPESTEQRL